jgi:plasmid stability protein
MNDCHLIFQIQNSAYRLVRFAGRNLFTKIEIKRRKKLFMANRKGVFIGAYVPNELKESLRRRAAAEHRTLSQEITRILVEAVHGKGLPAGSVDRRTDNTIPRRRTTDPFPRRRVEDLPLGTP